MESIPCIVAQRGDALRIIASAARFEQRRDPYLAIIPRSEGDDPDERPWWVQSWTPRYAEVDIDETFETVEELVKVMLAERERDIRRAVLDLTALTLDAYREFRVDIE